MSTFTTTLPPDCDGNYRDWFFVWHPPANPALTSDPALRRGTGMPEPAAKLGRYARLNTEKQGYPEGWNWRWMPMTDFAALMGQPAPVATDDGERERLRSSIRTAMNRMDVAYELLCTAYEDLEDGLLDGKEVKG